MIGTALNVRGSWWAASPAWCGASRCRRQTNPFSRSRWRLHRVLRVTADVAEPERDLLQILRQLVIAVLALMLGKLTGQLLRLQKMSNHLGRQARERISARKPGDPGQLSAGFQTCAALFCAAPLAILGSSRTAYRNTTIP